MTIHAMDRQRRRGEADARRAAEEAERRERYEHSQKLGAQRRAEKAERDAEAKAEAGRAYEIRYAAMTPWERAAEDHHRALTARWEAERPTAPTTPTDRPKPRHETMSVPIYDPPPAVDPTDADGLDARAKELAAKAEREPSEANKCQARIAGADAAKARAFARLEAERKAAELAVSQAVLDAGADPIARERAKARAIGLRAERIGEAEAAYQAAELARDRAVVEVAAEAKLAAWRIESRKAQIKADEARAANDPHAMGNPYYKPPTSLAKWQFDALPPETQARAMKDGVKIYDDPAPAFTAADARNILRLRDSPARPVVTRAEFAAMSPQDQAKAARTAIIVGD